MATTALPSRRVSSRRLTPSPIVVGTFLGVLAALVACVLNPDFFGVLPFALLLIAVAAATWRRLSPVAMSPGFYFAAYLAILALLGFFLTNALVGAGGTGGVDVALEIDLIVSTTNAMLGGSAITLAAAAAARGRSAAADSASRVLDLGDLSKYAGWFLAFGTIELVALAAFVGPALLNRPARLIGRGSSIETAIAMAAVAAVVVVGIAFFSRTGIVRLYAFLLLTGFVAYFVAMGTRRLALVPLLLVLAYAISRKGNVRPIAVVLTGVAGLLALALPLHFRGQYSHGLLPYVASLSEFRLEPAVIAASFNNFLAGFKITALTSIQQSIPLDVLWVSLNPISGTSAGWYDVSRELRLNRYTPYSAIGELMNYGPIAFVAVLVGIGVALGVIQRVNDKLLGDTLGRFISVISLGLVFIFVIQSAQYNLRSDVRYLYFALGIQAAGLIILHTRGSLERKHSEPVRRRRWG